MNFVKSIWALKPSTSNDSNNSNQQPHNSTTFTTTSVTRGNSFIITSTLPAAKSNGDSRPKHLVFQTSSSLSPEMMAVSPTDSFHSASSSTFEQKNEKTGKTNNGFTGSTMEMNNNNNSNGNHESNQHNQVAPVQQEQYWTWEWPFNVFWRGWNNREKIFLFVIVVLSISIGILLSILAVVLTRNWQLRRIIVNRLGADLTII